MLTFAFAMKILHYTPRLIAGDLSADLLEALVHSTADKASVDVAASQKTAIDAIRSNKPDILHVHGCWRWLTQSVVRAAKKAGCATVLSPHYQLAPYASSHERYITKSLRRAIYERRLTQSYDALLVSTERERQQLIAGKWHDRIDVVPASVLDKECPEEEMGQRIIDFYQKVCDTRYELLMTDNEHRGLCTLLHVGSLHEPTKKQISHESILNLRQIKPSQWRRMMLMADDEDIRGAIDMAVSVMQLDVPEIDASLIARFPSRHPKTKGSLPRKLLTGNPLRRSKIKEVLAEQDEEVRLVLTDLINVQHLLQEQKLSLRHVSELFETLRYTDFDEDQFQRAIKQLGLKKFSQRITQMLSTLLLLEEGYFPTDPLNDKTTKRYIEQTTHHKAHS